MIVTANIEQIQGHLRYGHYEVFVPGEEEDAFKLLSREAQIEYIEDNGHIVIDDFTIEDYGEITNIKYKK